MSEIEREALWACPVHGGAGMQGRDETGVIHCASCQRVAVKYVPVPDEQAIERAARALCEADTSEWDDCAFKDFHRNDARKALAAALEQPE